MSKFIFYHETFFMEQMQYIFKSIIQRPFSLINLECTFLFNIAFFFRKKKERKQKSLKMYTYFYFWLTKWKCFYIFHYLRGGKKADYFYLASFLL